MEGLPSNIDAYGDLQDSRWDTLRFYLMVTGVICLLAAGLFIYVKHIHYRDYILNGSVLGRYLLFAGLFFYFSGRAITYYQRFQRKKAERGGHD